LKLRQIAVILFILFFFSTIFTSPACAIKSIRFELTAEFIKTEYVNDVEDHSSIYTTTRLFGDFGYEGSFDASNGMYQVQAAWLDTFNIQNNLLAKATLHLTVPKLTDAEYHFIQDDQDPGNFYHLEYHLDLLNNIEIPLISDVGVTPLEFGLTGEDVCNNIDFIAYKRGNETHHDVVEINTCEDRLTILTIILEVDNSFWDGNPRIEVPSYLVISAKDDSEELVISNHGSGDLKIDNFLLGGDMPTHFGLRETTRCTSNTISPGGSCFVNIERVDPIAGQEITAWLDIYSNSITSPNRVQLVAKGTAGMSWVTLTAIMIHLLFESKD